MYIFKSASSMVDIQLDPQMYSMLTFSPPHLHLIHLSLIIHSIFPSLGDPFLHLLTYPKAITFDDSIVAFLSNDYNKLIIEYMPYLSFGSVLPNSRLIFKFLYIYLRISQYNFTIFVLLKIYFSQNTL